MTTDSFSQIMIADDKVVGLSGDDSESTRTAFAREAEGLQSRAHQVGLMIGMRTLTCCSISYEGGGIAFRFAASSDDNFDAKGVFVRGSDYTVESLRLASL
ncbi:MAG: hypothetical protein P1U86_20770 [Verrucomicrobiales bacterium]|nr:hypothetical protein [Verrucomicrobiales bacterium]